ncbi:amyloid fiber anchoring/assembly protein TapA [Oceanobacillus rekensis]|uniref:amyloid fiber anchoring/assembly protein TapA n=1 Tax=Oceanobacillus rekensis TaxID=937927 RepID=UPI0015932938|nr:amyloid fiber anchoring/assembly protein TapA [Oceanobacillus rekensis]
MRKSHLKRFKSKDGIFLIVFKVTLIWYLLIFAAGYLTSDTAAHFNDYKETSSSITVGIWEEELDDRDETDKSSLSFITKGNQNIKACQPTIITTELKNKGPEDMKKESSFDVYYISNGNPEKHGEKLQLSENEGKIDPLKNGGSTTLSFNADKAGVYVFKAKEQAVEDSKLIWSKWIDINCPSENNQPDANNDSVINEEVKPDQQNDEANENNKAKDEKTDTITEKPESTEAKEDTEESKIEKDAEVVEDAGPSVTEEDNKVIEEETTEKEEETKNNQEGEEK